MAIRPVNYDEATAARFLGTIYRDFYRLGSVQLEDWALPESILADTGRGRFAAVVAKQWIDPRISNWPAFANQYARYFRTIIPRVRDAAIEYAGEQLAEHGKRLARLERDLQTENLVKRVGDAAKEVALETQLHQRIDEAEKYIKQVTAVSRSETGPRGALPLSVEQVAPDLKGKVAAAVEAQHDDLLSILFNGPDGLWVIRDLSVNGRLGAARGLANVRRAAAALEQFSSDLKVQLLERPTKFREGSVIWRFRPFIVGGLIKLGLFDPAEFIRGGPEDDLTLAKVNKPAPGFTSFVLQIAEPLGKSMGERLVDAVGLALTWAGLAFPLSLGLGFAGLAVGAAQLGMTFLRERQQELAASASDYGGDQKIAEHLGYRGTALGGALLFITAILLFREGIGRFASRAAEPAAATAVEAGEAASVTAPPRPSAQSGTRPPIAGTSSATEPPGRSTTAALSTAARLGLPVPTPETATEGMLRPAPQLRPLLVPPARALKQPATRFGAEGTAGPEALRGTSRAGASGVLPREASPIGTRGTQNRGVGETGDVVAGPEVFAEISAELGPGSAAQSTLPGVRGAVADAQAAGLIGSQGAPGTVDAAFQAHGSASDVRAQYGVTGAQQQSAHINPTAFLQSLPNYSRRAAPTLLLDPPTHRAFDNQWKAWAIAQRRAGRTDCSIAEMRQVMHSAIDNIPNLPPRVRGAVAFQLDLEIQALGLADHDRVPLPFRRDSVTAGTP
jgi:hypothetical protein